MTPIVVSRRPVVGPVALNVLQHEAGGLNIDSTRIGYKDAEDLIDILRGRPRSAEKFSSGVYSTGRRTQLSVSPTGRWPTNMLLEHRSDCVLIGTSQVRAKQLTAGRRTVKWGVGEGASTYERGTGAKLATGTGMEAQRVWDCACNCPIHDIDQQGVVHAGGTGKYFKQIEGAPLNTTADVPESLIDYLYTLITPTHVGGESLIALDIDAVDWVSIPDGKYHGVIARGEPTVEQVDHMWRVVRPGAHVLLIAPDSSPTGHRGACALEDKGFEIRDTILWVREAGKLHYVPKANSRERNAGCEKLAQKRKGPPIYELTEEALADEEIIGDLQQALIDAGMEEGVVDSIVENGIPKSLVPKGHKQFFQKREGSGKYGNNHPCVKPKEIMARLLRDVPQSATVLDPFLGSGSTGLACIETGHNFIGIEQEPEYLEIADTRIRHWNRLDPNWDKGAGTTIKSDVEGDVNEPVSGSGLLFDLFEE